MTIKEKLFNKANQLFSEFEDQKNIIEDAYINDERGKHLYSRAYIYRHHSLKKRHQQSHK